MKLICDFLPIGKCNKITSADLMRLTGISTPRELSAAVRQERLAGALILSTKSGGGGYYLPTDAAEVEEFINSYSGEARSLFVMLRSAREYMKVSGEVENE